MKKNIIFRTPVMPAMVLLLGIVFPAWPDTFLPVVEQSLHARLEGQNRRAFSLLVRGLQTDTLKKKPHQAEFIAVLFGEYIRDLDPQWIEKQIRAIPIDNLPPMARDAVMFQRLHNETGKGDFSRASADSRAVGVIRAYMAVGPFENQRGLGFREVYGPEKEINLSGEYAGKTTRVRWRSLIKTAPDGYVNLNMSMVPDSQAVSYLAACVESPREQIVMLRIGSSDGVKVWCNFKLLLETNRRRYCRDSQELVMAPLRRGRNILRFKVAVQKQAWGFRCRVSRADGTPGADVRLNTGFTQADVDAAAKQGPLELKLPDIPGAVAAYEKKRGALSPHDAYRYTTMVLYSDRYGDQKQTVVDAFKAVAARRPKDPLFQNLLAMGLRTTGVIRAEKDENERRRALLAVITLKKNAARAYLNLAHYYRTITNNRYKARQYTDMGLTANPDCFLLNRMRWTLLFSERCGAAARAKIAKAEQSGRFRDNPLFNEYYLQKFKAYLPPRTVTARYDALLKRRTSARVLWRRINDHNTADEQTLTWLRRILQINPYNKKAYMIMARKLQTMGRPAEAFRAVEAGLRISPDDHLYFLQADLFAAAGDYHKAVTALKAATAVNPNNRRAERRLSFYRKSIGRKKTEKAKEDDSFEKPHDPPVASIIAGARGTKEKNEQNLSHRVLLKRVIIKLHQDGTTGRYDHYLFKVLNRKGAREFTAYSVPYAEGEQIVRFKINRIHRPDGTVEDGKITNRPSRRSPDGAWKYARLSIPTLEIGDIYEVAYRRDDLKQNYFGNYYGGRHYLHFDSMVQTDLSELVLIKPLVKKMFTRQVNTGLKPSLQKDGSREILIWRAANLSPIIAEAHMPPWPEVAPQVEMTTYPDWTAFADWWWHMIKEQFETTPDIRKTVADLTRGASGQEEKARRIFNFITEKIRYVAWEFGEHGYKPYKAGAIFSRQFGDCKDKSILLITMLKEIGISAYPALVYSTHQRGREDLSLAMIGHFNHCIAYVPGLKGGIFLDGTGERHGMNEPLANNLGARALVIQDGKARLLTVPETDPLKMSLTRAFDIVIYKDKSAAITARMQASGFFAPSFRNRYATEGKRRELLEKQYASALGKVSIEKFVFADLKDLNSPPFYTAQLTAAAYAKPSGRRLSLKESIFPKDYSALASREKRRFDFVLGTARYALKDHLTYTLPDEWTVSRMPESVTVKSPYGFYEKKITLLDKNRFRVDSVFYFTQNRVPAADYGAFRDYLNRVALLEKQKTMITEDKIK